MSDTQFSMSPSAASRISAILAGDPAQKALRVSVLAGGCNGFQYKFSLESALQPNDVTFEQDGAVVVVDPDSLELLANAQLHYADELMGSYFTVRNPNAKSSCGCGSSFSVD